MPKFSIVVPALTVDSDFINCISSILCQSFTDLEIIVVTTDDTFHLFDQYFKSLDFYESLPILCISSPKKGIYNAMNVALSKVSAKWILFLGQDDSLYSTDVLASVNNYIEKRNIAPNLSIISGHVVYVNSKKSFSHCHLEFSMFMRNNFHHQATFYSSDCFGYYLYDECLAIYSDYKLNYQLYLTGISIYRISLNISNFNAFGISNTTSFSSLCSELSIIYIGLIFQFPRSFLPSLSLAYLSFKLLIFKLFNVFCGTHDS